MPPKVQPVIPSQDSPAIAPDEAPRFIREVGPDVYRGRERYAAQNVLYKGRDNLLGNLRQAMREANGRTVLVTVTYK